MGITAGEAQNPRRTVPHALRQVFWRILFFYVFSILVISIIIPYTDPRLLRNDVTDIAVSPLRSSLNTRGFLLPLPS